MTDGDGEFLIRPARQGDLDVITGFEIDIARVSFGAEAVTERDNAVPVGWAWLSGRTNSLTGARYGNFRSLATADIPGRAAAAELLMTAVLQAAKEAGYTHLTGKTHARNLGMRALYRKFGFEATHLTMEWRPGEGTRR